MMWPSESPLPRETDTNQMEDYYRTGNNRSIQKSVFL